ncbi:MAG: sigma-70 family RNA polymerase sigma factor [Planctomycetes bacterium]|nr:sigma-70 family RNA polymerase sigma factor [Planctomycetota bacterium]
MNQLSPSYSNEVRACVVRIRESGAAALGGLYDLTAVRLVRFSYTICQNQHDAEDAVSAALLRVASDHEIVLKAANPWAYLLQMVRNESLLILRKRKKWNFAGGLFDFLFTNPENALERHEAQDQISKALQKLPKEQAEVVVLKIWEDLTFLEIGTVLHIPAQTAASRYRYALTKLASLLGQQVLEVNS